MIEDIEDLPARLNGIALLEREVLEYRHVPVLEALVTEDVPAHIAEGSKRGRSYERVAVRGDIAPTGVQRSRGDSMSDAPGNRRGRQSRR